MAVVLLVACRREAEPEPPPPAPADTRALLAVSWMERVVSEPAVVDGLLDAPGGDGWIALWRGDLDGAEKAFRSAESPSATLGAARVHLARADLYRTAAALQSEAAQEVVRYRATHRDRVRSGAFEELWALRVASLSGGGASQPVPAKLSEEADPLKNALRELVGPGDAIPAGLPETFRLRLQFARAVDEGRMDAAIPLLPKLRLGEPDLRDLLGTDAETGIRFELRYYDGALLPALARYHLARAWSLAGSGEGAAGPIKAAVLAAWGGPLPVALPASAPFESPLPEWVGLFLAPTSDRAALTCSCTAQL